MTAAIYRDRYLQYNHDKHVRRSLMLQIIKCEVGCVDCGYDVNPLALDFDHLGDKLFGISQGTMRNIKRLQEEISKCVVRCANCHRIRTHKPKGSTE
jgi:hypothetical protein